MTWRSFAYALVGLFAGVTATFPNALTTVNTGVLAGPLGLYAAQAAALPAVYVAVNASANLLLVKARAQFGITAVTVTMLALYAIAGLGQFLMTGLAAAIALRAADGMAAAALTSLGVYYMMQAMPPRIRALGAVIGIGLPQIGTPLARMVPVDVLTHNGLFGLHAIEVAMALATIALVLILPLPATPRTRAFQSLDLATIALFVPGMLLVCQVIGQGRTLWWADTPWLGDAMVAAIVLLTGAWLIESARSRPLVHFEWIGTWGIVRFALVALVMRLALAEQTYGSVGLLTLGGLNNDQLRPLFAVVALAMALGIGVAALTTSPRRLPWQVLAAALVIAAGAWIDTAADPVTRPEQMMISQAMIGFGTTLFVGPALLYGYMRMVERGADHLVSFVVTFSITQNVGGLLGSALLGSLQVIWARQAAMVLAQDMTGGNPLVAARLASGVVPLAAAMNGQAAIIAFTDVFRFVALLAVVIAAFVFFNIAVTRRNQDIHA